jgi:hypothetical protein
MWMLRWIYSHTRGDDIEEKFGVAPIQEKLVQYRLRWFDYIQRRPLEAPVRSGILNRSKNTRRGGIRPRLTCAEAIKKYLKEWSIPKELALDRSA